MEHLATNQEGAGANPALRPIFHGRIMREEDKEKQIGLGYPSFQLAKALDIDTSIENENPKVKKWLQVIKGMLSGSILVGSRTPVKSMPSWVTLEVIKGGFATSNLLAGGEQQKYELNLLENLQIPVNDKSRQQLNLYFISDIGIDHLNQLLESGNYSINVPEEGAMLTVATLIKKGKIKDAKEILTEITPYFDRLRFYPKLQITMDQDHQGGTVFVQSVNELIESIGCNKENLNIKDQKNSILIWTPFYDKLISLFMNSFYPVIYTDRNINDQKLLPLRAINEEWLVKKENLLQEYSTLSHKYSISNRWSKSGSQFSKLIKILEEYSNTEEFIDTNQNYLIQAVRRYILKHGYPDTENHVDKRKQQKKQCDSPEHLYIKKVLVKRLEQLNRYYGVENINDVIGKISRDEVIVSKLPINSLIPHYLIKKVEKTKVDQIENLVSNGVIGSSDILAKLLPQISGNVICSSITESYIKQLYKKIYLSFRLRRSLLLLNYQSQVKINEIPWIEKLDQFKELDQKAVTNAENVLKETFILAFSYFPYVILPNKLLQEFRSLLKQCNKIIPLTDEIAADIFMGGFSPKYAEAAYMAAVDLEGSLYSRYYNIDYTEVRLKCSPKKGKFDKKQASLFSSICNSRVSNDHKNWSAAANGMVIEQQQIITTHNMSQLFGLVEFNIDIIQLVLDCFKWISKRYKSNNDDFRADLIMVKNIAYAWRQMIFLLSKLDVEEQKNIIEKIEEQLISQSESFKIKFKPLVKTLINLIGDDDKANDGYVLTGWTTSEHFLLKKKTDDKR